MSKKIETPPRSSIYVCRDNGEEQQHRLLTLLSHANLSNIGIRIRYAVIYKLIQMLNKPAASRENEACL